MKENTFNRENNALPLIYDPNTFLPIKEYFVTNDQLKFLGKIRTYLETSNNLMKMGTYRYDHQFISTIMNKKRYRKEDVNRLLDMREIYRFIMKHHETKR